ncbi:MAG TPA: hypothetical protein VG406_30070 [Isosphaeraceae bacterium]|nr:hypothetical protein [Isosphaeraceae bacterium]
MTPRSRRSGARAGLAVAAGIALALAGGRAEAQFFGGGYGGGFFFRPYTPPSVTYLNQRSLIAAQAAAASRPTGLVNPHGRESSGRDYEYYPRYDVATRRSIEQRTMRPTSTGEAAPQPRKAATPAAHAVPPLSSYFLKDHLEWPADAPASGEFALKRTECNEAVSKVLKEFNTNGSATIASATDARAKLLDYGRPALKYVREQSSPRIAEAFNSFLMSLYDSIGQAATPRTS